MSQISGRSRKRKNTEEDEISPWKSCVSGNLHLFIIIYLNIIGNDNVIKKREKSKIISLYWRTESQFSNDICKYFSIYISFLKFINRLKITVQLS